MIPSLIALAAVLLVCALIARECFKLVTLERRHMAEERATWATERGDLLQRIQAPEQAVIDHSVQEMAPAVRPVAMDDDRAQWAAMGVDLPKDELAEMAYQAELA